MTYEKASKIEKILWGASAVSGVATLAYVSFCNNIDYTFSGLALATGVLELTAMYKSISRGIRND